MNANAPIANDATHTPATGVIIIGAGFAGLAMAMRLRAEGRTDFVILEAADSLGGTWLFNAYPGAACDVPSHLYSLSFALNPDWSRVYSGQAEILSYIQNVASSHGVISHIRFQAAVNRARFDESRGIWEVTTEDGRHFVAPVLVSGCGGLHRPALPNIPGLETFAGPCFHSARWPANAALAGKKVAVIGTGASAVQIVPAIVDEVETLDLFQRTPPWILPRPDRAYTPSERWVNRKVPGAARLRRLAVYWRNETIAVAFVRKPALMAIARAMAVKHIARQVKDPELRRIVTPNYTIGCKRILMSNDYYRALQRPGVRVHTAPISAIEPTGIRTQDGALHAVDALVLATGFQAADNAAPFPILGRGGVSLGDVWQDGAAAYRGTTVSGFPNLFLLVGPNTGLGHSSMIFIIESQVAYVVDALRKMRKQGLRWMDVRRSAQDTWNDEVQTKLANTVWASGCNSWYQNQNGRNTTLWPGFTFGFRWATRRVQLRDYEVA